MAIRRSGAWPVSSSATATASACGTISSGSTRATISSPLSRADRAAILSAGGRSTSEPSQAELGDRYAYVTATARRPMDMAPTNMARLAAEPYEFTFDPGSCALVIIDMQRDFVEPGGFGEALGNDVSLLRKAVPPTERVLLAARRSGMLVIHTREGHRPDLSDLQPSKKARGRFATGIGDTGPMGRILVRGEHGHDIVDALKPIAGEPVIDKPGKGAFYATDLDAILTHRGISQLVVCGATT